MTVSRRYTSGLAALFALGILATASLRIAPRFHDTCQVPASRVLESFTGESDAGVLAKRLPSSRIVNAFRGTIPHPMSETAHLTVRALRSFAPLELYEAPLHWLDEKLEPETHEVLTVEVDGQSVPIHVVRDRTRSPHHVVAYLFVYGSAPVASPWAAHMGSLPRLLAEGLEPMTLFVSDGPTVVVGAEDPVERRAIQWVSDAWRHYQTSCR